MLGSDATDATSTIGKTPASISYTASTGRFIVSAVTAGDTLNKAGLDVLVQNLAYENQSVTPTVGENTERVFKLSVSDSEGNTSADATSSVFVYDDVTTFPIDTDSDGILRTPNTRNFELMVSWVSLRLPEAVK